MFVVPKPVERALGENTVCIVKTHHFASFSLPLGPLGTPFKREEGLTNTAHQSIQQLNKIPLT